MTRLSPLAFEHQRQFADSAAAVWNDGEDLRWSGTGSFGVQTDSGPIEPVLLVPLPDFGHPSKTYRDLYDKTSPSNSSASTRGSSGGKDPGEDLTNVILSKVNVKAQCPAENDIMDYLHEGAMTGNAHTGYHSDTDLESRSFQPSFSRPAVQLKNAQQIISDYIEDKMAMSSTRVSQPDSEAILQCRYCNVRVENLIQKINQMPAVETTPEERSAVLSLHERHCATRMDSCCVYCKQMVADVDHAYLDVTVQRVLHQRVCAMNPSSSALCVFCGFEFRSSTKVSAIEQVFEHEAACARRPENTCLHCGRSFPRPSGFGTASDNAILMHNMVCPQNPSNQAWCPYCGRNFRSTFEASAPCLCESHIANCSENPANKCQYCDMSFAGDANSPDPMDQAAAKLSQHIFFIHGVKIKKPLDSKNKNKKENKMSPRRPTHPRQEAQVVTEALCLRAEGHRLDKGLSSAENPDAMEKLILTKIRTEKRQILSTLKKIEDVNCLRLQLRKLQMQWHPDKRKESPQSERIQREIFDFVMKCWDRYLSVVK